MITFKSVTTSGASPEQVNIECVWLSGENAGEKFLVEKHFSTSNKATAICPNAVYFPPQLIVLSFEVVLSLGTIAALGALLVTGARHLQPEIRSYTDMLQHGYGEVIRLFGI